MKKKHLLLAALFIMMLATVLTGCTADGNGFMALNREIASLEQFSFSGDMSMSLTLPGSLTADATEEDMAIFDMLSDMQFTLSGSCIKDSFYYDYTLGYELDGTKGSCRFIMDKSDVYINIPDMIALAKVFVSEDELADIEIIEEKLDGIEWFKYNNMDIMDTEDMVGMDEYAAFNDSMYDNIDAYQNMVYDYIEYLNKHSFAAYKPDIFSRSGSKYTMTISGDEFYPVVSGFIEYIITNYPEILQDTRDFIADYDLEWLTEALGVDKQEILDGFDEMMEYDLDMDYDELAAAQLVINSGVMMFDGSSYEASLEKKSGNRYKSEADMNIVMTAIDETMTMSVTSSMTIDASATVTPDIPDSGVMDYNDLMNTFSAVSISASIYAPDGFTVWDKSYDVSLLNESGYTEVTLINRDNSYYLPLRQVGELLGEDVNWDQDEKVAYVLVNSERLELTGFIVDGRTYVKLRAFEKIGYTVNWDAEYGEIFISKNY